MGRWISCVLVLLAIFTQQPANAAALLETPQLQWSVAPSNFAGDAISRGNGVAVDSTGEQAYVTSANGKLLNVPLGDAVPSDVSVLFEAPTLSGYTTTCQSGVVLYSGFAVYAVVYVNQDGSEDHESRLFVVPTSGAGSTRTISVNGEVKGTPLINLEGHVIVVHNFPSGLQRPQNTGTLSIFDLNNGDASIATVPTESAGVTQVRKLAPPALTRLTLDDGVTEVDWIVFGENRNGGLSNQGRLYGVRYQPSTGTVLWHVLTEDIGGSTFHPPAVSSDGLNIVLGVNRNTIKAWVDEADMYDVLHNTDANSVNDIDFTFDQRVSRADPPPVTPPVLLSDSQVLIPDQAANLLVLSLTDRGRLEITVNTLSTHAASPIVHQDEESGKLLVYDVSEAGILRQIEMVSSDTANVNYEANCVGFIDTDVVSDILDYTETECGSSVFAHFALTPDGASVVYASENGAVTSLRMVESEGTPAPSKAPSATPTLTPTARPTVSPTNKPTLAPSPQPSDAPSAPGETPRPTTGPTVSPTDKPTIVSSLPADSPTRQPIPPTLVPTRAPQTPTGTGPSGSSGDDDDDDNDGSGGGDDDDDGGGDDDDDGGDDGSGDDDDDDDDDDDPTASGLGANVDDSSGSSNNMGSLAMILGVVAVVLFAAILGTLFFMKRRRRKDERNAETARMERENAVQKAWMSNKERYEEEMRREEEETMNDLIRDAEPETPEAIEAAQVLSSRKQRKGRSRLARRRNSGMAGSSTLGSISESECEDDDLGAGASDAGESGFEIALELMESGDGYSESEVGSSSSGSPNGSPDREGVKPLPNELSSPVADFAPTTTSPRRMVAPEIATAGAPVASSGNTNNHQKWVLAVMGVRSSSFKASTPARSEKAATPKRKAASLPEGSLPEDDDEPGLIQSSRRFETNHQEPSTPRSAAPTPPESPAVDRQIVPASPASVASPSDLLSVDSSLYLEGSTVSPRLSPPEGGSVLSNSRNSVRSRQRSANDPENEELFNKSLHTPGAHYLVPKGRAQAMQSPANKAIPGDESPTTYGRSDSSLVYEEGASPRGATMYGGLPPHPSRAGLFSRRGKPVDRLLPYESDATASASETEAQEDPNRQKIAVPKKQATVMAPKMDEASVESGSISGASTGSGKKKSKKTGLWHSFIAELNKAEDTFFNPRLSKAQSSQNEKQEEPPPPPPEDEDVPPPPPMSDSEDESNFMDERSKNSPSPKNRRHYV